MSIPVKINGKHLYQIMEPNTFNSSWSESTIIANSIAKGMFPSIVQLTSETYSRDAERTADYELKQLQIVNRKAKPEFTWELLKYSYAKKLFEELDYYYGFADQQGNIDPVDAPTISVTYYDLVGQRTINSYLGQTIEGTLVEYNNELYWSNLRIAFPER